MRSYLQLLRSEKSKARGPAFELSSCTTSVSVDETPYTYRGKRAHDGP
jgi:hypothetical protein